MRKVLPLGVLAASVLALACASLGRATFREPIVTYRDARITGLGIAGGSMDIVLGVYNPNNFRLDGTRLTYTVMIDSIPFGSGSYDSRFQVEEGDTSEITLPLTFTYAGVGEAGRRLVQLGSVEYEVKGDMTVATPLGQFTRPYSGRGRLTTMGRTSRPPAGAGRRLAP